MRYIVALCQKLGKRFSPHGVPGVKCYHALRGNLVRFPRGESNDNSREPYAHAARPLVRLF
jgi:hypothetical protein